MALPVHIGCSGWQYRSWKDDLYAGVPQRRWLAHYASRFETVEVNATFYRLARRDSVARWVQETPDDFLFSIKASRYLTHLKRLTDVAQGIENFYAPLEPLLETPKMGPVLWQLPERFHRDEERLAAALAALPPGRHAWEFRHPSWFAPDVLALLREHDVALVVGDHPERPFQPHETTTDWTFVRFHHGARGRRGNYARPEIDAWAARIDAWRQTTEVFAYFNNDWEGFAPRNAAALRRALSLPPPRRAAPSATR